MICCALLLLSLSMMCCAPLSFLRHIDSKDLAAICPNICVVAGSESTEGADPSEIPQPLLPHFLQWHISVSLLWWVAMCPLTVKWKGLRVKAAQSFTNVAHVCPSILFVVVEPIVSQIFFQVRWHTLWSLLLWV